MLAIDSSHRVLEIGCGLGRIAYQLQQRYQAELWGCDISVPAINEAQKLLPDLKEQLFVSPAERLACQSQFFDRAFYWGVFEMVEQKQALVELSRVLKVGGKALLCSVKNPDYHPDDEDSYLAHRAYIEKSFPLHYSNIAEFELLLDYLGFGIVERLVFERKSDVVKEQFSQTTAPAQFSDAYYIIEKRQRTPLDQFTPAKPDQIAVKG